MHLRGVSIGPRKTESELEGVKSKCRVGGTAGDQLAGLHKPIIIARQ